jgi:DNA polymerase alpha subunit B
VLEGSSASCGGARVNVDLSHLKSSNQAYSLFPGQIVAVEGMNPTGRKLVAHRICEGAAHAPNTSSVRELRQLHHDRQDGSSIKVITASGPFTTIDSMSYQPLIDLLHVIMEQSPDVVILTGPFVDMRQDAIKSGRPTIEFEDEDGSTAELVVSHEAFFANKVTSVIEEAFSVDEALKTQFVFVPSLDDATAKWV